MSELPLTDQRNDLVWQLRTHSTDTAWIRDTLMRTAADEIERLRERLALTYEALTGAHRSTMPSHDVGEKP